MNSNRSHLPIQANLLRPRRSLRMVWIAGTVLLTLVGCVSNSAYEEARQEAKERYGELAQTQADIQGLENQRDTLHTASRRDEQSLANLKHELKTIQASYDQIQKANRDKLAALQRSIAALRARHQAMLKEIRETKRHEERLKSITSTYEKVMGKPADDPQAQATSIDGTIPEQKLIAVVTPQPTPTDPSPIPSSSTASPHSDLVSPPTAQASGQPPAPAPTSVAATSTPTPETTKVASPSPQPTPPPAPQEESWLTSLTAWFTSLFDWIWA